MSDLRIALVAEGPTDFVIIDAALKAILEVPFIMTQLQPEETAPDMGSGWGGVLKWCHHAGLRHAGPVDQDPTLSEYDLIILHIDVDVSLMSYQNCGPDVVTLAAANNWGALPCAHLCPPVITTCNTLQACMMSWLHPALPGPHTVLCLPAQSSGTWLAAAMLPSTHRLLNNTECNTAIENGLSLLPLKQRVRKSPREYRQKAHCITENWQALKNLCTQAQAFETALLQALP